jgi:hypothetical protein
MAAARRRGRTLILGQGRARGTEDKHEQREKKYYLKKGGAQVELQQRALCFASLLSLDPCLFEIARCFSVLVGGVAYRTPPPLSGSPTRHFRAKSNAAFSSPNLFTQRAGHEHTRVREAKRCWAANKRKIE